MPEVPYSNRELDEKLSNLSTLIREKHDDVMVKMGEIIVQTTKTNGKVINLTVWRAWITGAIAALTFFIGVVAVPVISAFIQKGSL